MAYKALQSLNSLDLYLQVLLFMQLQLLAFMFLPQTLCTPQDLLYLLFPFLGTCLPSVTFKSLFKLRPDWAAVFIIKHYFAIFPTSFYIGLTYVVWVIWQFIIREYYSLSVVGKNISFIYGCSSLHHFYMLKVQKLVKFCVEISDTLIIEWNGMFKENISIYWKWPKMFSEFLDKGAVISRDYKNIHKNYSILSSVLPPPLELSLWVSKF